MPLRTTAIRKQYGGAEQFLLTFNPDLQLLAGAHVERAYTGNAPTLAETKGCYGMETLLSWICSQLERLNDFCGARKKMELDQQIHLATLISIEYHYLKITELMLFFYRFQCSYYGRFYGSVDAMLITEALLVFGSERRTELARFESERLKREKQIRHDKESEAITYDEYLILKQQKNESI